MQCNTVRQRARARTQKILIFRLSLAVRLSLGRLFPNLRDQSSGNGCSFNFRLPERIDREREIKGYVLLGIKTHGVRPINYCHAVRKKASLSSSPRATYRKNSKISNERVTRRGLSTKIRSTRIVPEIGDGAQHHRKR